eukprot:m.342258 g.342258  ORF g.342258 m.342258 type:complete len:339 (+) comp16121_c0_seq16:2263-3279(+)
MSIEQAIQDYKSGKSAKEVLKAYPDVKRSSFYYHLKKSNNNLDNQVQQVERFEQDKINLNPIAETFTEVEQPQFDILDNQPQIFEAEDFGLLNTQSKSGPTEADFMADFGHLLQNANTFQPENITQPKPDPPKVEVPVKESSLFKNFFKKKPKTEEEKQIEQQQKKDADEIKRFRLVHQIRLYVYNYDLDHLNIIKPNREKFVYDLYNKNETELNKLLNFIKFHIRFQNKQVSNSLMSNTVLLLSKFVEVAGGKVGLQLDGLTEDIQQDEEIQSLLKEISIEFEASKPYFGAKTDITLKLLMKIGQKHSMNKMISGMKPQKQETKPVKRDTVEKFKDL